MRDPNRIEELMDLINLIWLKDPDLRFNQLIYILQSGYSASNNEEGKVMGEEIDGFSRVGYDLFNLEDDSFVEYLRKVSEKSENV